MSYPLNLGKGIYDNYFVFIDLSVNLHYKIKFMLNTENIQSLIDSGEGYNVEFKVRVPSKVRELTEEICAFANADGGYLLIGVDDNGQVVDTNLENDKPFCHSRFYQRNISCTSL